MLDTDYSQAFDLWLGTGAAQNLEDISSTNSVWRTKNCRQKIQVTGINFVENDLNTSPYGDLHFTKLDFDNDATGYDDFLAGGIFDTKIIFSRVMFSAI